MWRFSGFTLLFFFAFTARASSNEVNPGFVSSLLPKPKSWKGSSKNLFTANYNFPEKAIDLKDQPWMKLNPRNHNERDQYFKAVLEYGLTVFQSDILKGCPPVSPEWYHSPWMTFSLWHSHNEILQGKIGNGREPLCGLTREISARVGHLHVEQKRKIPTWGVGAYNNPGGYLLGKVWKNKNDPDLSQISFPYGTFAIKLLFSEASEQEVPYLAGSPIWEAYAYAKSEGEGPREVRKMRLVQIDFGIRDPRLDENTGWIFGTFIYFNQGKKVRNWKENLLPTGLMWGNDHGVTDSAKYKEQFINPEVKKLRDEDKIFNLKVRKNFGWLDRLNGSIDGPESSCLSCHSTAQVHPTTTLKHFMIPSLLNSSDTSENRMLWFRNIKNGKTFTFMEQELKLIDQGKDNPFRSKWTPELMSGFVSTDYSLQLRMSVENARMWQAKPSKKN